MKDLKVLTAIASIVCLVIGLGLSMVIGSGSSETTFQYEEGDIGYLMDHHEMESSIFESAFDAAFKARVKVESSKEARTLTSFIGIYEDGEHVAQYMIGSLQYDDDFLFEDDYIDFATGGITNFEENDDGYYWTQLIKAGDGSLRGGVDLRDEGDFQMWMNQGNQPVNDAEPVIYGIGVIEGTGEMNSSYESRQEFEEWAESQGKVITFELLISSEQEEFEPWDLREDEE